VTIESIVSGLLREDPAFIARDRDEFVHLVEVALRRAHWKQPASNVTPALMDGVHYELERLIASRPVDPLR
jgi:hypothetical protein